MEDRSMKCEKIEITKVKEEDQDFWMGIDRHSGEKGFLDKIRGGSGFVVWYKGVRAGLFHYCILWARRQFLKCMFISEEYRNKGLGRAALQYWEREMKKLGYSMVLLSTQADEDAQHFYRKLGYVDCGGIVFSGTPLEQAMEIILRKVL